MVVYVPTTLYVFKLQFFGLRFMEAGVWYCFVIFVLQAHHKVMQTFADYIVDHSLPHAEHFRKRWPTFRLILLKWSSLNFNKTSFY